jgi:hypothetical protein
MPFLFSTCHALSLAEAVTSGEPHTVHSYRPRCRFLLAFTRFSRPRYRFECATSASYPDGVAVAIDVHGSEDQDKDASSADAREARFRVSRVRCMRFEEPMRTFVPLLSVLWTSAVAGALPRGEEPFPDSGPNQDLRSDADPRRSTPSRRPGCLPPLRPLDLLTRITPSPTSSVGPSLTPPTRFPLVGERCLHGHCKHQSAVTRDPWHSRNKRLLNR